MIWKAAARLRKSGVLGMNRRNAEYIMKHNSRSRFPLVDDKVLTDRLARECGVPMPTIFQVLERHGEVEGFELALGGVRAFAIKPARGAGGSGILLIAGCREEGFVNQRDEIIPKEEVYHHASDILSGVFSLAGLPDKAIVQELIHPDPVFEAVSYRGVPDIRIVVYRGVPVMAMTRLPTRASDGKANLHRGAVGAGIDIREGRTLTAVLRSRIVTHHPDTGNPVSGIAVPHWERMLLTAAASFEMTGLGYTGVDQVIDRGRGPVLLELNARPGLAVQIANRAGLWGRLGRVDRAPAGVFATPESRVAWAREEFHPPRT